MSYLRSLAHPIVLVTIFLVGARDALCDAPEGRIPITTSSETALAYYLQGRDLADKIRFRDSGVAFQKAVDEDPEFALAQLNLAFAQPSTKGFFEVLHRAVALVDKVSRGERYWILAAQAGAQGLPMKQEEYLKRLVDTYAGDNRAHTLLANYYLAQQQWAKSVPVYLKAIELDPEFSQPYNQIGYAYRFLGEYAKAEEAFQRYVKLIPEDPNPYDSYAELLMHQGRFDESIDYYEKALTQDSSFPQSHCGVATNLVYKGDFRGARARLAKLRKVARNDGERRTAHFNLALTYLYQGDIDGALAELQKQHALAEKIGDSLSMANDLATMGNVLVHAGRLDEAMTRFGQAGMLVKGSGASDEVKRTAERNFLFNSARVAALRKDFATAKAKAEEFQIEVEGLNGPLQLRRAHELKGIVALEAGKFEEALEELGQAAPLDPYILHRRARAHLGMNDTKAAEELAQRAATSYFINSLNFALIRNDAKTLLRSLQEEGQSKAP